MKVLVPIKRVVDYNVKVRAKSDGSGVDTANVKMSVNPFDEIAVEEAVRLKEAGKISEIIVLTIGPEKAQEQLRTAMAIGADRGILVKTDERVEPLAVAKCIKHFVEKESPDIVIMGKQAIDGDYNQTGQMLAALLDWPQATFASKVEIDGGSAKVTREIDGGLETLEIKLPGIITTDLRLNEPRYAKLPDIMKAKKKQLDIVEPSETGVDFGKRLEIIKVTDPPVRQGGVKVSSVDELIDKLKNEAKGIIGRNIMSVLVIAEHDNNSIKPSTLNTITAARKIDSDVHLLVAGSNMGGAVDAASKIHGIAKVITVEDSGLEHGLAENLASVVVAHADAYSHILAPASTFGKNFMPRAAALLDVQQISDISAVIDAETFERPVYGGQAVATVKSGDTKKLITVRTTMFDAVNAEGGSPSVEDASAGGNFDKTTFIGLEESKSDRPELTSAGIVISGGRGLGSGEEFEKLIEPLADKLGAAVGASRAAVDAGYVPNDYQVGQTGKVVAPDLYIAIGISGAIQHLAGMKDSKVIVAINKDEDAPIFSVADYGLVADLFEAVPELMDKA